MSPEDLNVVFLPKKLWCGGKKIQFTNCIQLPYAMLYQPFSDLFVATNFEKKKTGLLVLARSSAASPHLLGGERDAQAIPQTQSRDSFLALDGVTVAVSQVWTKHDKAVIGWQKRIKSEGLSRFPV